MDINNTKFSFQNTLTPTQDINSNDPILGSIITSPERKTLTIAVEADSPKNSPTVSSRKLIYNISPRKREPSELSCDASPGVVASCPICQDTTLRYLGEEKTKASLHAHVVRSHFPWYIAIGFLDNRENNQPQWTTIAQKLYPAINGVLQKDGKLPEILQQLWGKLLHGFLKKVGALLGLKKIDMIREHVIEHELYGLGEACGDNPTEDEMRLSHQTYRREQLNLGVTISPPNSLSGLLNWVTLANLISRLPPEERENLVTYERYMMSQLIPRYKNDDIESVSPVDEFWIYMDLQNFEKLTHITATNPDVLLSTNPRTGLKPLQSSVVYGCTALTSVLLLCGANPDETSDSGTTVLCEAARMRNKEIVDILLAWICTKQLDKATAIAVTCGYEGIYQSLQRVMFFSSLSATSQSGKNSPIQQVIPPLDSVTKGAAENGDSAADCIRQTICISSVKIDTSTMKPDTFVGEGTGDITPTVPDSEGETNKQDDKTSKKPHAISSRDPRLKSSAYARHVIRSEADKDTSRCKHIQPTPSPDNLDVAASNLRLTAASGPSADAITESEQVCSPKEDDNIEKEKIIRGFIERLEKTIAAAQAKSESTEIGDHKSSSLPNADYVIKAGAESHDPNTLSLSPMALSPDSPLASVNVAMETARDTGATGAVASPPVTGVDAAGMMNNPAVSLPSLPTFCENPVIINRKHGAEPSKRNRKRYKHCFLCEGTVKSSHQFRSHCLAEHLPWFMRQLLGDNSHAQSSPIESHSLQKQLTHLFSLLGADETERVPTEFLMQLLGHLLHDFLENLADAFEKSPEELLEFVHDREHYCKPDTLLTKQDKLMINAHLYYSQNKPPFMAILSPPNCLSSLLHWSTLANLLRQLSGTDRAKVVAYDWQTSHFLALNSKDWQEGESEINKQVKEEFRVAIDTDLGKLWKMLHNNRMLATATLGNDQLPALHMALTTGRYTAATLLLMYGADTTQPDKHGVRVLEMLERERHEEALAFLQPWIESTSVETTSQIGQGHSDIAEGTEKMEIIDTDSEETMTQRIPAVMDADVKVKVETVTAATSQSKQKSENINEFEARRQHFKAEIETIGRNLEETVTQRLSAARDANVKVKVPKVENKTSTKRKSSDTRKGKINCKPPKRKKSDSPKKLGPRQRHTWFNGVRSRDTEPMNGRLYCPVCNCHFPLVPYLRVHVCAEHLPWYASIFYTAQDKSTDTRLSRQLMPALREGIIGGGGGGRFPHRVFSYIHGRLLHALLKHIARLLRLDHVSDLVRCVREKRYAPFWCDFRDLNPCEKLLVRSHQEYVSDVRGGGVQDVTFKPPNCLSSVLHWFTLARLVAEINDDSERLDVRTYEKYTSNDIVKYRRDVGDPDKAQTCALREAIIAGDINAVVHVLDLCPAVARGRLKCTDGDTSLMLSLRHKHYVIGTALLLHGADVDEKNAHGMTALGLVVKEADRQGLGMVLNWGPREQLQESYKIADMMGNSWICDQLVQAFLDGTLEPRNDGSHSQFKFRSQWSA